MLVSCYSACNTARDESACSSAQLFIAASSIVVLVIALLAIFKVGAFQNASPLIRHSLFGFGCFSLFVDLCMTAYYHYDMKKHQKELYLAFLKDSGIKLEVADKGGYTLNLGEKKDFLTQGYLVAIGNHRTYPVLPYEKAKPERLKVNQYCFYLKNSDNGHLEDVFGLFKLSVDGKPRVYHLNLRQCTTVKIDRLTHVDLTSSRYSVIEPE
jgi:hypothetical protein